MYLRIKVWCGFIFNVNFVFNCRQLLTDEELAEIREACDMAIELNASKLKIYEFVESRMTFIAPNLSYIIGASTAAKLMG